MTQKDKEEFKDIVDDLLFMIQGATYDNDCYVPDEYIYKFEEALNHLFKAESILENLMDEMEDNNKN